MKTYSKGDKQKLSANFKAKEFDCNGRGCCTQTLIDSVLVDYLQKIRSHFGKAVNISSAYRCPKHNAQVKNASKTSRHMQGIAADIKVTGIKPAQVAAYAETLGIKGIGLYEGKDGNFVHIDTRTDKFYWYGHAQKKMTTFLNDVTLTLPALSRGAKGEAVAALQKLLGVTADGSFGPKTETALLAFQKEKKLPNQGICDESTWKALLGVGK